MGKVPKNCHFFPSEARAGAVLAICEVGTALHRGQPAERLWAVAIAAAERWKVLAG